MKNKPNKEIISSSLILVCQLLIILLRSELCIIRLRFGTYLISKKSTKIVIEGISYLSYNQYSMYETNLKLNRFHLKCRKDLVCITIKLK